MCVCVCTHAEIYMYLFSVSYIYPNVIILLLLKYYIIFTLNAKNKQYEGKYFLINIHNKNGLIRSADLGVIVQEGAFNG